MRRCLLVFEPPDGGVPEIVVQLATGLRDHGWEPCVAGPRDSLFYPALERAAVPILRVPFERSYRKPTRELAVLRRLVATLGGNRFDLVHAFSAKAGALGRAAAIATRTPVVYSPQCFPFVGPWSRLRISVSATIERALAMRTDAILCAAEDERRQALARSVGRPQRLHIVHNAAAPCQQEGPLDPTLEAFAEGGPVAGCVAVLRAQKGIDTLLEAAPRVLAAVPDARIAVIGDGPLEAELRAQASAADLGDRVGFFAFRPPSSRQLRSLDVFVLPSRWEAFPLAVLEAMACGVPQVATTVGGTPEAVQNGVTGLLCPPRRPDLLAEHLVALLGDADRRQRMSGASRERYDRHFTVERMVAETAAIYDGVAA